MRNLKKYLAVLLAVAMMVAAVVPVTAADEFVYENEAQALHDLGLFQGTATDPNVFYPDLGAALDRQTGVVMLLRIFGLDKEAQAMDDADVDAALSEFTDAKSVATWAKKEVAYATSNGLIKGFAEMYGKFSFRPNVALEGKMYATLVLRQLGYQDATDFDYSDAVSYFSSATGADESEFESFTAKKLTRDDLVGMSYSSLKAPYKDDEQTTVLSKLVENGFVDADVAKEVLPEAFEDVTTPVATATATATPEPTGTVISSVSFANEVTASDATKAKVNVVFATAPTAVADSDFSVVQDVYVGTATTGTRTSVAGSVYSFDAATKTAVLKVPVVAAGAQAQVVKTYVKYLDQALVAAADYTVDVKGFAVALANDNPGEGNINKGQANVSFLSTTLTATGENATVNSVTVRRLGGADTDIASIRLYNGDTLVGSTTTSNNLSSGTVTITLTTPLVVVPGTPVNFIVKATASASATSGNSFKLGVESMALASGTVTGLPLYGSLKYINSLTVGGLLKVQKATNDTPAATVNAGNWVEAGRFSVTAEDQNATIRTFNFENTGTADYSQITKLRIKNASTMATVGTTASGVILSSQTETLSANQTKNYIVEVEVTSNTTNSPNGKTIAMRLKDLTADNGTTSQLCQKEGLSIAFNTMTISNITSIAFGRDTTTASDNMTVARPGAAAPTTGNGVNQYFSTVSANSVGYLVGVLSITAGSSSDMTVKTLNLNVVTNAGTIDNNELTGIGILDENNGVVLSPANDGTTNGATAAATFATTGTDFDIVDQVVLKGKTKNYKIYAFIDNTIVAGDMFTVHAKTTNAASTSIEIGTTGTGDNLDVNLISGGDIAFRSITVAAADEVIISAPAVQVANPSAVKGQDNVLVYKAKITAGTEPLVIENNKVWTLYTRTLSTGTTLASGGKLTMTYNEATTTLASTSTVNAPGGVSTLDAEYTTTAADQVIKAGESAELNFYVMIDANSHSSFTVALSDSSDSSGIASGALTGYTSAANVTVSGTYPTNTVTVNTTGTFAATASSYNISSNATIGALIDGANTTATDFVALSFTVNSNSSEDTQLTTLKLTKTGAFANAGKMTTIKIWDQNFNKLKELANVTEGTTTIDLTADSTIPKNGSATFFVGGTLDGDTDTPGFTDGTTGTLSIGTTAGDLVVTGKESDVETNVTVGSAIITGTLQLQNTNVAVDTDSNIDVGISATPVQQQTITCGTAGVYTKVASFKVKVGGDSDAAVHNLTRLKATNILDGTDVTVYFLVDAATGRTLAQDTANNGAIDFDTFLGPEMITSSDWTTLDIYNTVTTGKNKQIKFGSSSVAASDVTMGGSAIAVAPTENITAARIYGQ